MKKIQALERVTLKLNFWASVRSPAVGEDELNFIQCFSAHGATVHPSTFRLIEWSYDFVDDHP